jgi:hypothetical protein
MNETPSSAVTTARVDSSSSQTDGGDGAAVAADHADALAVDEHGPLDLLLQARALVEFALPADAPLYAARPVADWSGAEHDAPRVARLAAPGVDLVFDGPGEGTHVSAADQIVAASPDAALTAYGDPLVELGTLSADAEAFAVAAHDAPIHVDVSGDALARVDLGPPHLCAPELSWLADINGSGGMHVGEAWSWSDASGSYVFDHCV